MSTELPGDFYEYSDGKLSMCIPSYLRPKKGIRFFAPKSKKDKHGSIMHFAVEFLNDDGVAAHWAIMVRSVPGTTEEWGGVQGRVIRRGKALYLSDGLELLGS